MGYLYFSKDWRSNQASPPPSPDERIQVFDKSFIHECLIRPKYFFQKFNPSPAQRRKKTICMSFTLKLPQKLSMDFTFRLNFILVF
jgi:hypothetical protein